MQTKQRGLTREVGRFLANLSYADLPPEVIEMAKSRMLEALSVNLDTRLTGLVALFWSQTPNFLNV